LEWFPLEYRQVRDTALLDVEDIAAVGQNLKVLALDAGLVETRLDVLLRQRRLPEPGRGKQDEHTSHETARRFIGPL